MVKKILKLFAYLLFFIISVIYLSPKENIYYFLEQELKTYGVVISKEELNDGGYYLGVNNLHVSYKEIDSMAIDSVDLHMFALYNTASVENVKLAKALSAFIPVNISNVDVHYSIFDPLNVIASANGEFGEVKASFNILEKKLHLDLLASKLMLRSYKSTLRNLKKADNGEYTYEKSF